MRRLPYSPGVRVLLVDQALMNAGFYMLFPLLAVRLTQDLGFDATTAGVILGARMLVQQGAAPLGGAIADRVGYKPAIVAGFAIRTVGFLLFAVSTEVLGVLAGALVTALGGVLFDPPSRAALAYLTPERERAGVYAAAGAVSWFGQVVGPFIGALLLPVSFFWVSLAAAFAFLLAALQAALFLPSGMRGVGLGDLTIWGSIGRALRDTPFARFAALMLGYYMVQVQILITVPILATRVVGPSAIGYIFAIQAALAMFLQVPVSRMAARRMELLPQIALGLVLAAIGFAGYAVASSFLVLVVCTALVAVGQMLVMPAQSTVTARLAGGQGGTYFGVGALALGLGGALGNSGGGLAMDLAEQAGVAWLPWLVIAGVALASGAGFAWLARDPALQKRLVRTG